MLLCGSSVCSVFACLYLKYCWMNAAAVSPCSHPSRNHVVTTVGRVKIWNELPRKLLFECYMYCVSCHARAVRPWMHGLFFSAYKTVRMTCKFKNYLSDTNVHITLNIYKLFLSKRFVPQYQYCNRHIIAKLFFNASHLGVFLYI